MTEALVWAHLVETGDSALRYARKGWIFRRETWRFTPKEHFEPLYAFIRGHRELFDDHEAVEQLGVLFTQSRGGGGNSYSFHERPPRYWNSFAVDYSLQEAGHLVGPRFALRLRQYR